MRIIAVAKLTVLIVQLATYLPSTYADACPAQCRCLGAMIDCSRRGLTQLPPDLPVWAEIIDLKSNGITMLTPDSLKKNLTDLQQLDISKNGLTKLDASVLKLMPNLRILNLQRNDLTILPDVAHLKMLTILNLRGNSIDNHGLVSVTINSTKLEMVDLSRNRIQEFPTSLFPIKNKINTLNLENNRIRFIERDNFLHLKSLQILKMGRNSIEILPEKIFHFLVNLKYLDLSRNRLFNLGGLSFEGLIKLTVLKLSDNGLLTLSDGALYGLVHLTDLDLSNNALEVVDKGWLYQLDSLKKLNLANNNIRTVQGDAWYFCRKVESLNLSNNHLTYLRNRSFAKLTQLSELYLANNDMIGIENGTFKDLISLKVLDLNHNMLTSLVENRKAPFGQLSSLIRLGLADNQIFSLSAKVFSRPKSLTTIDLSENPISTIHEFAFHSGIKQLSLNSTFLVCDCQIPWLAPWLVTQGLDDEVGPLICRHPPPLIGESIFALIGQNLTCEDFPKPHIVTGPTDQALISGQMAKFLCEAGSTSQEDISVKWKFNDEQIDLTDQSKYQFQNLASIKSAGVLTQFSSTLDLLNSSRGDAGIYQCIMSNPFGFAYSDKAVLEIYETPQFLKTPFVNQSMEMGSNLQLQCAAEGHPPPKITWLKDGKPLDVIDDTKKRQHLMQGDTLLFLVNLQPEDTANYTCHAENIAGKINVNVSVVVLLQAEFIERPKNTTIKAGETAVLNCLVSGSPKPTIKWFHNGVPLTVTDRHFFPTERQVLVIVDSEPEDSGEYACQVDNGVELINESAVVTVIGVSPGGHPITQSDPNHPRPIMGGVKLSVLAGLGVLGCVVLVTVLWAALMFKRRMLCFRKRYRSSSEASMSTKLSNGTGSSGGLHLGDVILRPKSKDYGGDGRRSRSNYPFRHSWAPEMYSAGLRSYYTSNGHITHSSNSPHDSHNIHGDSCDNGFTHLTNTSAANGGTNMERPLSFMGIQICSPGASDTASTPSCGVGTSLASSSTRNLIRIINNPFGAGIGAGMGECAEIGQGSPRIMFCETETQGSSPLMMGGFKIGEHVNARSQSPLLGNGLIQGSTFTSKYLHQDPRQICNSSQGAVGHQHPAGVLSHPLGSCTTGYLPLVDADATDCSVNAAYQASSVDTGSATGDSTGSDASSENRQMAFSPLLSVNCAPSSGVFGCGSNYNAVKQTLADYNPNTSVDPSVPHLIIGTLDSKSMHRFDTLQSAQLNSESMTESVDSTLPYNMNDSKLSRRESTGRNQYDHANRDFPYNNYTDTSMTDSDFNNDLLHGGNNYSSADESSSQLVEPYLSKYENNAPLMKQYGILTNPAEFRGSTDSTPDYWPTAAPPSWSTLPKKHPPAPANLILSPEARQANEARGFPDFVSVDHEEFANRNDPSTSHKYSGLDLQTFSTGNNNSSSNCDNGTIQETSSKFSTFKPPSFSNLYSNMPDKPLEPPTISFHPAPSTMGYREHQKASTLANDMVPIYATIRRGNKGARRSIYNSTASNLNSSDRDLFDQQSPLLGPEKRSDASDSPKLKSYQDSPSKPRSRADSASYTSNR